MGHQLAHDGSTVEQPDCNETIAAHGGTHGAMGHHYCPHFGAALVAIAPLKMLLQPSAGALPESRHASFVSVVLDVPSPPPTGIV